MARVTRPPPFTRCTPSTGHSRSMTACATTPANAAPMNTRSATSGRASSTRRSHPGQPRDLPAAPTNTRSAPSGHASSTRRGHSRQPCRPCPSTTRTARLRATRHASPPSDDLVVRSERLLSDAAPPLVTSADGRQRRRTLRHPAPPANFVRLRNFRRLREPRPMRDSRSHRRFSSRFTSSAPVTNVDEKRRWVQAGGAKKTSVGGHAPASEPATPGRFPRADGTRRAAPNVSPANRATGAWRRRAPRRAPQP